jgi:hypothetical protein
MIVEDRAEEAGLEIELRDIVQHRREHSQSIYTVSVPLTSMIHSASNPRTLSITQVLKLRIPEVTFQLLYLWLFISSSLQGNIENLLFQSSKNFDVY